MKLMVYQTILLIITNIILIGTNNIGFAQQFEHRINGLSLSNDLPIQIESDRMDIDNDRSIVIFSGHVKASQGNISLQSGKMTVYYTPGSSIISGAADITRIDVANQILLKSESQQATADTGVFNMVSQTFILSGEKVVLTEGDNVFSGCKLTVNMTSGDTLLEGCNKGVKIQLNPKSMQ